LTFEYSTMFGGGQKDVCVFSDNADKTKTGFIYGFAYGDKIHIEACAVLSERLADKLKLY